MQVGANISLLRKGKGAKQEDVAAAVGVSAQAVSKWENGGAPDIELLPRIADFFEVSIDSLFERGRTDYGDMRTAVMQYVSEPLNAYGYDMLNIPAQAHDAAMKRAREIIIAAQVGLLGTKAPEHFGICIDDFYDKAAQTPGTEMALYTQVVTDGGIALTSPNKDFPFSVLFLEPPDGFDISMPDIEEYHKCFTALADADILRSLVAIHAKERDARFTIGHFSKLLGLCADKTKALLGILEDMGFVESSVIDLDEKQETVYKCEQRPVFVMLLILMIAHIKPPAQFAGNFTNRKKPFFTRSRQ